MSRTIYVAGSSRERERIARYIGALTESGWTVTEDWTLSPALDEGALDDKKAAAIASRDLEGVRDAAVFWLVAPSTPSVGAWVELGHAVAGQREVVISGPCPSIFARLANARYPSHVDALQALTSRFVGARHG